MWKVGILNSGNLNKVVLFFLQFNLDLPLFSCLASCKNIPSEAHFSWNYTIYGNFQVLFEIKLLFASSRFHFSLEFKRFFRKYTSLDMNGLRETS